MLAYMHICYQNSYIGEIFFHELFAYDPLTGLIAGSLVAFCRRTRGEPGSGTLELHFLPARLGVLAGSRAALPPRLGVLAGSSVLFGSSERQTKVFGETKKNIYIYIYIFAYSDSGHPAATTIEARMLNRATPRPTR